MKSAWMSNLCGIGLARLMAIVAAAGHASLICGCVGPNLSAPEAPITLFDGDEAHEYVLERWSVRIAAFVPGRMKHTLRPISELNGSVAHAGCSGVISLGGLRGPVEQSLDELGVALESRPCWLVSMNPPAVAGIRGRWERSVPPTVGERMIAPMINVWLIQQSDSGTHVNAIAVADSLEDAWHGRIRVVDLPAQVPLASLVCEADVLQRILMTPLHPGDAPSRD